MHRRRRRLGIISLRRRTIARIFALSLVALSLLPFSAPFKTFDLASSHSGDSPGTLPNDKADADEKSVIPPDGSPLPPHLTAFVVAPFTRPSQLEEHPISSMVLRL
jgi:hypothetical protein